MHKHPSLGIISRTCSCTHKNKILISISFESSRSSITGSHGRRNFRRSRRNPVPVPIKLPSTKAPATTLRTTGKMTASSGFRNTQGVSDIYSFSKRKTSKSTPSNANIPQGTALKVKTTALIKENDNTSRNNSVNITRPAPSEASNVKISGNDNIANYSGQYKGQSHNKTWVRFLRTISEVSMSTH